MTTGVAGEDDVDSISRYLSNFESCSTAMSPFRVKKEKGEPGDDKGKRGGYYREAVVT